MPRFPSTVAKESYGSASKALCKKYSFRDGDDQLQIEKPRRYEYSFTVFRDIFLPQGYPSSVSSDYLNYQIWDSAQAFCSSLTGALSTRAILKGVGVGDDSANIVSATATWLLKDGAGMMGRIVFAWLRGTQLDCDAKRWRLFADIINDLALGLDILSPHFGSAFTYILCLTGVLKAIVGVAGGATRAALTQHQARRNNLADVSAKDGSQETLVNLVALICSLLFLPLITGQFLTCSAFIFLTVAHIVLNYLAVTSVQMETFNKARLQILVSKYVLEDRILTVPEANRLESVCVTPFPDKVTIQIGASLQDLTDSKRVFQLLRSIYSNCNYLINLICVSKGRYTIVIVLHQASTERCQLSAMFEAAILAACLSKNGSNFKDFQAERIRELCSRDPISALNLTRELASNCLSDFINRTQHVGWRISPVLFGADDWRFKWQNEA